MPSLTALTLPNHLVLQHPCLLRPSFLPPCLKEEDIYIYSFSRRFCPKRLSRESFTRVHRSPTNTKAHRLNSLSAFPPILLSFTQGQPKAAFSHFKSNCSPCALAWRQDTDLFFMVSYCGSCEPQCKTHESTLRTRKLCTKPRIQPT